MRCVKLFVALVSCIGFLNASSFALELEDQTGLAPAVVPKVYAAFTAADQDYDTCLYLSGAPGEGSRPVRNHSFTNLALYLWMFRQNNIHDAPFEAQLTVRDLLHIDLGHIQNIKVVVSAGGDSQFFLSLFVNGVLMHGPQVSTTFVMDVDPKSLPASQEILPQS